MPYGNNYALNIVVQKCVFKFICREVNIKHMKQTVPN